MGMAFYVISAVAVPVAQPVDPVADATNVMKLETRDKKNENDQDRKRKCRRDRGGGRRGCDYDDDDDDYSGGKGGRHGGGHSGGGGRRGGDYGDGYGDGYGGGRGGRRGDLGLQQEQPNKGDQKDKDLHKRSGGGDLDDHGKGDWADIFSKRGYGGGYGDKGDGYGHGGDYYHGGYGNCRGGGNKCGGDWGYHREGEKNGSLRPDQNAGNDNVADGH
ncbi:uncharacterized protein ColSpa_09989 [Colletotrichum spaethianum]|uniref:Uncharacterized protein n=1 Tax=Colletotrichum spaethianum TaxID=700344 RepID=A0AA37PCK9_9PEZI|nr:uncharacterized protein ColSpa_09989 [Colletotrichum spaethianum]GKT49808.1 hypothetical protein ColSpa_09989 [Colletotrichum spaethianum]